MISNLETILGADAGSQAIFEASRYAETQAQVDLLEAVIANDGIVVGRVLEKKDHNQLLSDGFFLPLAILLATQAGPAVLREFSRNGYNETALIKNPGSQFQVSLGELAISIGSLERHRSLVEEGFLSPEMWAYQGMGRSDPDIFDYWSDLYWKSKRNAKKTFGLETLRWMAKPIELRKLSAVAAQKDEAGRRLRYQIEAFLDCQYPAPNASARWQQVLAQPFGVEDATGDGGKLSVRVIQQILEADPELRKQRIPVLNVFVRRGENLARALLDAGFVPDSFEQDLVCDMLVRVAQTIELGLSKMPPSTDNLWRRIVEALEVISDPRLKQLPQEILGAAGLNALLEGNSEACAARLQPILAQARQWRLDKRIENSAQSIFRRARI